MLLLSRALRRHRAVAAIAACSVIAASSGALAQEPALTVDLGQGVQLELVLVRAGTFVQGSPAAESGRNADEAERQVTISRDFYVGKVPVTRGQFARFVAAASYRTEAERGKSGGFGWDGKALVQKPEYTWKSPGFPQTDDHPVVLVTYDDARAFAGWLAGVSGRTVDLPTEAQWEYAARAGTKTRFYTGASDKNALEVGWFKDNAGQGTKPVGQKTTNAWGLRDMSGNVWEWCLDYYGPYSPGPVTDPLLTASPSSEDKPRRVLRGGSWLKDMKNLRSAARYRNAPGSRNADNGFRIIASVEKSAAKPPPAQGPQPLSDVPDPRSEPEDTPGRIAGIIVGTLCAMFGFVGLLIGIAFLLRRIGQGRRMGGGHGISVQPGHDGFWVRAPGNLRNAVLAYRYRVGGRAQESSVVLDGSPSQFVYTGVTPANVEVLQVIAAAGAWASPKPVRQSRQEPTHHVHEPFRGYPSAY